jgi:hypothetical protein
LSIQKAPVLPGFFVFQNPDLKGAFFFDRVLVTEPVLFSEYLSLKVSFKNFLTFARF